MVNQRARLNGNNVRSRLESSESSAMKGINRFRALSRASAWLLHAQNAIMARNTSIAIDKCTQCLLVFFPHKRWGTIYTFHTINGHMITGFHGSYFFLSDVWVIWAHKHFPVIASFVINPLNGRCCLRKICLETDTSGGNFIREKLRNGYMCDC